MPIKENYNKNRRVERGLFQSKGTLINSDVNGSLQIMRKAFPDSYTGYGIEVNLTPTIINAV
jgi:putative transposase